MKDLLKTYGWEEILSKNPYMKSYIKDDKRMNYYYTTGTVQIQGKEDYQKIHREIFKEEQLERIISND